MLNNQVTWYFVVEAVHALVQIGVVVFIVHEDGVVFGQKWNVGLVQGGVVVSEQ